MRQRGVRVRIRGPGHQLRQPEVQNLDLAALVQKDVGGLDVTVNDAERVRVLEGVGHLHANIQHLIEPQGLLGNPLPQRCPFQQLHDEERLVAVATDVVQRADVRMIERRRGARLALETVERGRILRQPGRQELHRHLPAQASVLGPIDDTHPAFADLVEDAVMGDGLADHGRKRAIL